MSQIYILKIILIGTNFPWFVKVVPNEKGWVNKKYKLKVKELKELIIKEFRSER